MSNWEAAEECWFDLVGGNFHFNINQMNLFNITQITTTTTHSTKQQQYAYWLVLPLLLTLHTIIKLHR